MDVHQVKTGAGAAGIGTLGARLALIWVTITVAASSLINTGFFAHPWLFITTHLLLLAAALLLTSPEDSPLPPVLQGTFTACTLSVGVLALATAPELDPMLWPYMTATYFLALNVARGNLVAGSTSMAVLLCLGVTWVLIVRQDFTLLKLVLVNPILALTVGFVWHYALEYLVAKEQGHRTIQGAQKIQAHAAQQAATEFRRDLMEIRALSLSSLETIRDGQDLSPENLLTIAVTEGSIRDRIRSPKLQVPALRTAISMVRERGVRVLVLGEPSSTRVLTDQAIAAVCAVIAPVTSGHITIRELPPDREASVTVLIEEGPQVARFSFGATGEIIEQD